jgi:hypothetical protein
VAAVRAVKCNANGETRGWEPRCFALSGRQHFSPKSAKDCRFAGRPAVLTIRQLIREARVVRGSKGISRQESGVVVNFTVWAFESLAPGYPFTSRRMEQFVRHPPHGSPIPGANQASVFSMIR